MIFYLPRRSRRAHTATNGTWILENIRRRMREFTYRLFSLSLRPINVFIARNEKFANSTSQENVVQECKDIVYRRAVSSPCTPALSPCGLL